MWWFNAVCLLGKKKPLEVNDLYSLNPDDLSSTLVPRWNQLWGKAMKAYNTKRQIAEQDSKFGDSIPSPDEESRHENSKTPLLNASENGNKSTTQQISPPSILLRIFLLFKWDIILANVVKCISDLLTFANPLVLKGLITFTQDVRFPIWYGVSLATIMFVASELSSLLLNQYYYLMYRVGTRIQTCLTAAVYQKALSLSNVARRDKTVGEIVNLMALDIDRFQQITPQSHQYWSTPMQIALSLLFLWNQIGISVLSGVAIMLLLLPINFLFTMKIRKYQMGLKDERIKMVNEVLNGIKVIKLYAWEIPMEEVVTTLRDREIGYIKKGAFLRSLSDMLNSASPFLVALSTFATFIFIDEKNVLTPEIAFVSLTLFNQLRTPMGTVAELIAQTVQVIVSNRRLKQFLVAEELVDYIVRNESAPKDPRTNLETIFEYEVEVSNASMTWDRSEPQPTLKNISLHATKGDLIAIVGKVGSGKSSLLMSLLGEMEKLNGYVRVDGNIAYVPQQPWVQNQTVRQNIVFGADYDENLYLRVLDQSCLHQDLAMLSMGDQTEIGEKGINLSGGQKARISLARAIYQNRDIYLLDDPLSAVDSHVGAKLFENVIGPNGLLKNKTRILVTHELSYLKYTDRIIIMDGGRIVNEGSYAELMKSGAFEQLIEECKNEQELFAQRKIGLEKEDDVYASDEESLSDDTFGDNHVDNLLGTSHMSTVSGIISQRRFSTSRFKRRRSTHRESLSEPIGAHRQLTGVERVETGRVKLDVYAKYFEAMGYSFSLFFIFGLVANTVAAMARNVWLADWSNDNSMVAELDKTKPQPILLRLEVYALIGFAEEFFMFFGMGSLLFGGVAASRNLHAPFLHSIFRAPMRFFDTTPFGRILNRIGKDIETVDMLLPYNIEFFVHCILQVASTLLIIIYSTPIFTIVILPLALLYAVVLQYYIATSRQLKRLESITRSPIYSHLSESINGVSTIHAYNEVPKFCRLSEQKVDTHVRCRYLNYVANRWLSVRLEFIGNCVVLFAALFAVLARETTSPGVLGLSISYSLNITFVLNFAVRQISKLETNIVSVERVKEYTETTPEAEWESKPENKPPKNWPSEGRINIIDYSTRYRPGLDLVVKKLNAEINTHEKVGIVGRTGAGKSSVTLALFRMIEPDEGRIVIDGVNISNLGLHDLRSNLTIIPQDPVLFSGSLRFNLDPFNRYSDNELWSALEYANLKEFAYSHPGKLEHEITEGGANISVGQRQLVCLARALLRKSKVLVLDEATAAVDMNTDALIQKTIREQFKDSTVLTIAHRLNTIMDYDRIIVLDSGRVKEFDSPANLMSDKKSIFYSMVKSANHDVSPKSSPASSTKSISIEP
uniref:Multidrug resistance-associated protein 1 n=1 Tax=Acrobeloides nanus TaxID=290746 RepID=A0A914E7D4_9BILA